MHSKRLKMVTECGMMVAAALALSQFKLFRMPLGGSVSLGIMPLLIISARYGAVIGCWCGAALGILLLAAGPFVVHPIQFLLDYPLAYAALGLAGLVSWTGSTPGKNALKATTATAGANLIRLHFHVVAGAVFFATGKDTLLQAITASYLYNLSHMVPETIICMIIAGIMARNNQALCCRQEL